VQKKNWKILSPICFIIIGLVYWLTHLISLTLLPVFADEAIYIRWAQLIIDDWQRYLFFSMNDGKTPLFVWLVAGALKIWHDPLFAGRLVSLIAGFIQIKITAETIKELGGGKLAQIFGAFTIVLLPFWYFHHRMALMDALLTTFLSASFLWLLKTNQDKKYFTINIFLAILFLGLALFTKIPAILFFPSLVLISFLPQKKSSFIVRLGQSSLVILGGILIFALLKLTPIFSQLFSRGSDFLYPINELLDKGALTVFWANTQRIFQALFRYLSWPIVVLPFFGLFQAKLRKTHVILILSFLGFVLPILVLGKTIYPRYILPSIFPLTVSAALSFEYIVRRAQASFKNLFYFIFQAAFIVLALTSIVQTSFLFMILSWKNPYYLPFVPLDRVQYLTEWSAGNGIKESTELMLKATKEHSLIVATEGYFGTLPDGVLMYLHNQDYTNLRVEGIGQPVYAIPDKFIEQSNGYEKVWLLVNSHREKMRLMESNSDLLIEQYCRGNNAPCLQLWDITSLIKN